MTPRGVEHSTGIALVAGEPAVEKPMTPRGVEHNRALSARESMSSGEADDAERR